MKWSEVPDGASLAMSKETAMSMRAGRTKPFVYGVICGALLTISLQSCGDDNTKTPDTPKPSASVSSNN